MTAAGRHATGWLGKRVYLHYPIGARPGDLVLIYAGRIESEKEADVVVNASLKLPESMGTHLVMLDEGNLVTALKERTNGKRVHFAGFVKDRLKLATMLASSDIYVSAMAHETFGISIIEAQAAGLPVVGINAGEMPDRVTAALGKLGPVSDADVMAGNVARLWQSGEAKVIGQRARVHVKSIFHGSARLSISLVTFIAVRLVSAFWR